MSARDIFTPAPRRQISTVAQEINLRNNAKRQSGIPVRVAATGTSMFAGTDAVGGGITENTSYLHYAIASLMSSRPGEFALAGQNWNQSVGGATYASAIGTTQINAALAMNPDIVLIGAMVNDHNTWTGGVQSDATFATELAKYQALANRCVAASAFPIFFGDDAAAGGVDAANKARFNRVLARWCERKGYGYVETRPYLCVSKDGNSLAANTPSLTHDDTHVNVAGAQRLATPVASAIAGLPLMSPWQQYHRSDYSATSRLLGANLVDNGCCTDGTTGAASSTGWSTVFGSSCTAAAALESGYSGGRMSLTRTATTGDMALVISMASYGSAGVVAGTDLLRLGFRGEATISGTGSALTYSIQNAGTILYDPFGSGNLIDQANSPRICDFTPDAGSTAINIRVRNEATAAAAATGVVKMGNVGIFNLTVIDTWLVANGFV